MIDKNLLVKKYLKEKLSVSQISDELKCSQGKIDYWLKKHNLNKRTISDAQYIKRNPKGDPFSIIYPQTKEDYFYYGLGLGLFWGEGNKANKSSVRLGNTDPGIIRHFLYFLKKFYKIDLTKLRFGLQLFHDLNKKEALHFWTDQLGVKSSQFQKVVYTPSVSKGTYTKKCKYGVLTLYFSNIKLRNFIVSRITELQNDQKFK